MAPTPSSLSLTRTAASTSLFVLSFFRLVAAQLSDVNCPNSLSFLSNERGQDPCVMVSCLWGAAQNRPFRIWDLNANHLDGYPGPVSTNQTDWPANKFECSMPAYNLIAACELCQGKDAVGWTGWTASCNSSFTGEEGFPVKDLPMDVPASTTLPPWVFIDSDAPSTGGGQWSQSIALRNITAETDESSSASAGGSSTAAGSSGASTGAAAPSGSTLASEEDNDDGGSSSNTGAIAGGVVGGLALLGLIGVGGFWLWRRHQNSMNEMNSHGHGGYGFDKGGADLPMNASPSHSASPPHQAYTPEMHQAGGGAAGYGSTGYSHNPNMSYSSHSNSNPFAGGPRSDYSHGTPANDYQSSYGGGSRTTGSRGYSYGSHQPPEIQAHNDDLSRPDEYPAFRS